MRNYGDDKVLIEIKGKSEKTKFYNETVVTSEYTKVKEVSEVVMEGLQKGYSVSIQTYSNNVLHLIGELIELGVLDYQKVRVLWDEQTKVTSYDEEGYLTGDWIYGYMQPDFQYIVRGIKMELGIK